MVSRQSCRAELNRYDASNRARVVSQDTKHYCASEAYDDEERDGGGGGAYMVHFQPFLFIYFLGIFYESPRDFIIYA